MYIYLVFHFDVIPVELEGYETVHSRTHVNFSVADFMEWFKQLKMYLFQE